VSAAAEDAAIRAALTCWFGIERSSCEVLCALYRARGAPLSAQALASAALSTRKAVVNHHMHRLRQALAVEAIDYHPEAGYCLTEEGIAECRDALRQVGDDLRRAS